MDRISNDTYRIIVIVLVIALIIAVIGWVRAAKEMSRDDIAGSLGAIREEIQDACGDVETEEGRDECGDKLDEFGAALQEYQRAFENLNSQASGGTTTQAR